MHIFLEKKEATKQKQSKRQLNEFSSFLFRGCNLAIRKHCRYFNSLCSEMSKHKAHDQLLIPKGDEHLSLGLLVYQKPNSYGCFSLKSIHGLHLLAAHLHV